MTWTRFAVIISADVEWRILREIFPDVQENTSPLGEWFTLPVQVGEHEEPVLFFHGGWGKIAAAASTQYVIDRWHPSLVVNLGTCGGIAGAVEKGTILLVERTLVYDIVEQMGEYEAHLAHYATDLDLSWLREPYPHPVLRTLLVSGDRDILPQDIPWLTEAFGAVAADWESGAIAWVAKRNGTRCLILRGVTDLVDVEGGEAYEDMNVFVEGARQVLNRLVNALPDWLERVGESVERGAESPTP